MAQQFIVTTPVNSGNGTPLANAFNICNNNFSELYSRVQTNPPATLVGSPGDTAGMYAYDAVYFYYCFADYDGSSFIWGQVTQAGNVTNTQLQFGDTLVDIPSANANVQISVAGTANVAVFNNAVITTLVPISVSGNVTANNFLTSGIISAVGNISTTGTISSATEIVSANVSASGNITGAYFSGNGAGLTGVIAAGNVGAASQLANGTSVLNIPTTDGNIIGNISGTAGVFLLSNQGLEITGFISATGNVTGGNLQSSGTVLAAGLISTTGNLRGANINTAGLVTATGNVTGGNINTAGMVTATGNVTGGNIITAGLITATGNVTANYFIGNGSQLTGVTANSIGTLTDLSVTGNINTGNLRTAGIVTATGNITGGNVLTTGLISTTGNAVANVVTALVGNITNLDSLNFAVENISALVGNNGVNIGAGGFNNLVVLPTEVLIQNVPLSAVGNVTAGNLLTAGLITATGNITGGNILSGALISATGNITGGNILSGALISATGNVDAGNISLSTSGRIYTNGNIAAGQQVQTATLVTNVGNGGIAILNGGANGSGNIGNATGYFNTIFATATTALYADLAECYLADQVLEPGTVVMFGGDQEITRCDTEASPLIAGVVSTRPAYQMNSGLTGEHVTPIALVGRVPCQVQGPVTRGAMMVSAGNGRARAETNPMLGTVLGKALESFDGALGTIEIVVGRL